MAKPDFIFHAPQVRFISKQKSTALAVLFCLEAPPRFELGDKGFADPCLTTWLWRHSTADRSKFDPTAIYNKERKALRFLKTLGTKHRAHVFLERITGLEPATFALARRRSTK